MHGDYEHDRESREEDTRNELEEERLDPVVELQQQPDVSVLHRVIAELIRRLEESGRRLRLVLGMRETCVRNVRVILLHHHRHLYANKRAVSLTVL